VVQRWESDRVFPNVDSFARLAEALPPEELLGITGAVAGGTVRISCRGSVRGAFPGGTPASTAGASGSASIGNASSRAMH